MFSVRAIRHSTPIRTAIMAGILLCLTATAVWARGITMTAALIQHEWIGWFQYTLFNGQGQWTPNEGDVVDEIALQCSLDQTNFADVDNGLGTLDGNNVWSAGGLTLHDGRPYYLRGRIKYHFDGGSGEVWSSPSSALSCEP